MTEVNNNGKINNFINFQKADLKKDMVPKTNVQHADVEFVDFSNPKAESLGRSQVSAKIDSIDNDTKFMMKHPETVNTANKFFDKAYDSLKNEDMAYEKAAILTDSFKNEFLSK